MNLKPSFAKLFILFITLDLIVFILSCGLIEGVGFSGDNFNLAYPFRVLISTAIQNGIFPFWNHWSFGGSPLISIYSTTAMSPLVWFFSFFGVYGKHTFILEMISIHLLGFCGMFLWLRLHVSQAISIFGAISFCLSAYMVEQFPINIEGAANPCFYPWYALGLSMALKGQKKGIALTALSLYALFTIGYLGTNVIAFQIISFFCILSFWRRDGRGIRFALIAGFAFLLMLAPILFETFSNQPLQYFTNRTVEAFVASARGRSFVSFFFPNQLSPFVSDPYGGHWALLYTGIFSMFLMFVAIGNLKKNRFIALLVFFSIFSFVSMLSNFNPLARLLVELIPFYNKIRFHVWNTGIVIFFTSTLSAVGLEIFFKEEKNKKHQIPVILFLVTLVIAFIAKDDFSHWYDLFKNKQIYFLPIYFLLLFRCVKMDKNVKVSILSILLLMELSIVKYDYTVFPPQMKDYPEVATSGFPAPSNMRDLNNSMTNGNGHYFSKVPHLYSYMPQIHPLIANLVKDFKNFDLLHSIFYPAENVMITQMNPSQIEALIHVDSENSSYVWSSPYSSNWQLTVNGEQKNFIQNHSGLIEFSLPKGENKVSFHYLPRYFYASLALALMTMLVLLTLIFRRDTQLLERAQKI